MGRKAFCNDPKFRSYVASHVRKASGYLGDRYMTSSQIGDHALEDPGFIEWRRMLASEGHTMASSRREIERALIQLADEDRLEEVTVSLGDTELRLYRRNQQYPDTSDREMKAVRDALRDRREVNMDYVGPVEVTGIVSKREPGLTRQRVQTILSKLDGEGLVESVCWKNGVHDRFAYRAPPDLDRPHTGTDTET